VVFLLGAYIAWFAWIKRARPVVFHAPEYHPAMSTLLAGVIAIAVLAFAAYAIRRSGQTTSDEPHTLPPAWVVLSAALVFGFPWYGLMALIFGRQTTSPFEIFMLLGVAWAAIVYWIIRYWASSPGWSDMHRWALNFGATLVCMIAGFSGSESWPRNDVI